MHLMGGVFPVVKRSETHESPNCKSHAGRLMRDAFTFRQAFQDEGTLAIYRLQATLLCRIPAPGAVWRNGSGRVI